MKYFAEETVSKGSFGALITFIASLSGRLGLTILVINRISSKIRGRSNKLPFVGKGACRI